MVRQRRSRSTLTFETEDEAKNFARTKFNEGLIVTAGTIIPHLPRRAFASDMIPSWLEEGQHADPSEQGKPASRTKQAVLSRKSAADGPCTGSGVRSSHVHVDVHIRNLRLYFSVAILARRIRAKAFSIDAGVRANISPYVLIKIVKINKVDGEDPMKKFLLGTVAVALVGMAAPALAADLAARPYTKAPPPYVAPIYDWTGFYIGGNGGWGQSHNCVDFLDASGVAFAQGCRDRSGGLSGGQLGYRWQSGPGCLAWKLRAIGRISATRAKACSFLRSPLAAKPVPSASLPARSATPGMRHCST